MNTDEARVYLPKNCRAREILDRIASKWSLYVIGSLGERPRRFTDLKRGIDGISQRMLTVTLRGLERDGIVSRTVYDVMPPHVEYALTSLGETLLDTTLALLQWTENHFPEIEGARTRYDARLTT